MTVRFVSRVGSLLLFAALCLPFAALAGGQGNQNGSEQSVPALGPFGIIALAAGVGGAGILITRNRRKNDKD